MSGIFKGQYRAVWSQRLILILVSLLHPGYKLSAGMRRLLIGIVLFCVIVFEAFPQGELDEQQKVFFRNERSFAFLLNTDGIGFSYRFAKRLDYLNKRLIEIDAGTLKNAKEYRQRTIYQGGSFVFGKLNSTFFLRGGLGHQHELYKKADLGGIAIRYFYSGGPVFAISKPIYYRVISQIPGGSANEVTILEQKYDVSIVSPAEIYGKSGFTKGLKETKFTPGLYAKGGFNFEYSKEDRAIHAIEIGGQVNAFPKEIPILAAIENKKIFFSLFVSYRFGMILDPLHPESNSIVNIFRRKKSE